MLNQNILNHAITYYKMNDIVLLIVTEELDRIGCVLANRFTMYTQLFFYPKMKQANKWKGGEQNY